MRLDLNASLWHDGVSIKPEICEAMAQIDTLHKQWTNRDAWFTSIVDGIHQEEFSLHYQGLACDLRFWYIPEARREEFRATIQETLGPKYVVILERTHFHIHFRPRRP
jgi:hypothetical protein